MRRKDLVRKCRSMRNRRLEDVCRKGPGYKGSRDQRW